jgi:hypothetical protein
LAVGFLAGQRVEVLHLDATGLTTNHTPLDLPRQRIRALVPDPTGDLYIAVDAAAGVQQPLPPPQNLPSARWVLSGTASVLPPLWSPSNGAMRNIASFIRS